MPGANDRGASGTLEPFRPGKEVAIAFATDDSQSSYALPAAGQGFFCGAYFYDA